MRPWLLRGLVFAFVVVLARVVQGALINNFETQAGRISLGLLLAYVPVPVLWGYLDGRADARAHPDPDRRDDLAMVWLAAGLIAGAVSGAICWLISTFYRDIYAGGPIQEVTVFAASTALLVFVAAIVGVTVGRWLVDRRGGGTAGGEGTDTDVFAAVSTYQGEGETEEGTTERGGEPPTQESPKT